MRAVLFVFVLFIFLSGPIAHAHPGPSGLSPLTKAPGVTGQAVAEKRRRKRDAESRTAETPPLPERRPAQAADASNVEKPSTASNARENEAPLGPPPPPPQWTEDEIKAAEAECGKLLGSLPVAFDKLDPIRDGVCGDPAPILLKGFTDAPRLTIRPSAVMNCKMAAAIRKWVAEVVQPRAKDLLHANVIRFDNASAYVCRTRYNAPDQRMSEHAFANAFDVSGFITAKGERIDILEHWDAGDERAQFLKDIHAGACKIFGTTLGPEANEAHRNHFHFDLAARRSGFKLCDFAPERREAAKGTPVFPTSLPRTRTAPAPAAPGAATQSGSGRSTR